MAVLSTPEPRVSRRNCVDRVEPPVLPLVDDNRLGRDHETVSQYPQADGRARGIVHTLTIPGERVQLAVLQHARDRIRGRRLRQDLDPGVHDAGAEENLLRLALHGADSDARPIDVRRAPEGGIGQHEIGALREYVRFGEPDLFGASRFEGEEPDVGVPRCDAVDDGRRIRQRKHDVRHTGTPGELPCEVGRDASDGTCLWIDPALNGVVSDECRSERPGGRQVRSLHGVRNEAGE